MVRNNLEGRKGEGEKSDYYTVFFKNKSDIGLQVK